MAFFLNGQQLRVGRPFTLPNGTQYPANWLRLATEDDKAAIGITWKPDPEPIDTRFYSDRDSNGVLIPKRLEDEPVVDENGDPLLDEKGEQVINRGLKTQWIARQKQAAGGLLSPSDWYIVRYQENGTEVPAAVLEYRAAVRTASGAREAEIAAVTSVEELKALLESPPTVWDADSEERIPNPDPFITPWPEAI